MSCDDTGAYVCNECEDAWETYRDSKASYGCSQEAYAIYSVNYVTVGDCIQVRIDEERIWLKVTAVCECYYLGVVMYKLENPHPFKKGDLLRVEIQHVFNVENKAAWCVNYKL